MTQKLFPTGGTESQREGRLLRQHGPAPESYEDLQQRSAREREREDVIILHIDGVRERSGDDVLRGALADRSFRNWVAAQPGLPLGSNIQWHNPLAAVFAQRFNEALQGAKREIDALHGTANETANRFEGDVAEAKTAVDKANQIYNKSEPAASAALPRESDITNVLDTLPSAAALTGRFSAAIELLAAITQAEEKPTAMNAATAGIRTKLQKSLSDSQSFNNGEQKRELERLDQLYKDLDTVYTTSGIDGKTALKKTGEELEAYVKYIVEEYVPQADTLLSTAVQDVDSQLSEERRTIANLNQTSFAPRIRYLNRLGGSNAGALIALSINDDGKLDVPFLERRCAIILGRKDNSLENTESITLRQKLHTDAPELKKDDSTERKTLDQKYGKFSDQQLIPLLSALLSGGWAKFTAECVNAIYGLTGDQKDALKNADEKQKPGIIADFISCWDCEEARKYLEEDREGLHLGNPTGISLPRLHERASLPPDVADALALNNLAVSRSTLCALSLAGNVLDGDRLHNDVAIKIVEWITKEDGGSKTLRSEDALVEALTLANFAADTPEAATLALKQAKKDTKTLLMNNDCFLKRGDARVVIVDPNKLIAAIQALDCFKNKAANHAGAALLDKTKNSGVATELDWKQLIENHASEGWKLTKFAAGTWWEYIKSLPKNFWDREHDKELLKALYHEDGLEDYRKALVSMQNIMKIPADAADRSAKSMVGLAKAREESLRPLGIAASPWEHAAGAEALVRANLYVRDQLEHAVGWSNLPLRQRLIALWIGMHKGTKDNPEAGIELARTYINGLAGAPDGPDAYTDEFINNPANFSQTERDGLKETFRRFASLEARSDRLNPLRDANIYLKQDAAGILAAHDLTNDVGRWMQGVTGPQVADALDLILVDTDGKNKLIDVLKSGGEKTYNDANGILRRMTPVGARLIVLEIKTALLYRRRVSLKTHESLKNEERFTNPLETWARTGVETLQDLWSGDWVSKAEVAAIVAAGTWLVWTTWKKGGLFGKGILVGVPLLMGANAVYRHKTERDLLGEKLTWRSKEERATPLESFRDRAALLDQRFLLLSQPSGDAAMRALIRPDGPSVAELIAWREEARKTGNPAACAPEGLGVGDILDHLGSDAERPKAYEVALTAFEALCADVAALRSLGGAATEDRVQSGADYIGKKYHNRANGCACTMFDVLIEESAVGAEEAAGNPRFLEYVSDIASIPLGAAGAYMRRGLGHAKLWARQGAYVVPELYEAGKEKAQDAWGQFMDVAATTWAKGKPEVMESLGAVGNFLATTAKKAGITLVTLAPEFVEWGIEVGKLGKDKTAEIAVHLYDMLLTNGVTGPILLSLGAKIEKVLGFNILDHWKEEKYLNTLANYDEFRKTLRAQLAAFAKPIPSDDQIVEWLRFDGLPDGADMKALAQDNPRELLMRYDLLKRRLFSFLAAKRIEYIWKHREDPDFSAIPLPLELGSWPDDFNNEYANNSLASFVYANYRPDIFLSLIGNERTLVGIMQHLAQTDPGRPLSKFCSLLLYPEVLQKVSNDSASEFLAQGVHRYLEQDHKEARQALDEGKITLEQYEQFMSYLDTLVTNVVMETILSDRTRAVDLKLIKEQAKNIYEQLMMRRGVTPDCVKILKITNKDGTGKSFEFARWFDRIGNLEEWNEIYSEKMKVEAAQASPNTTKIAEINKDIQELDTQLDYAVSIPQKLQQIRDHKSASWILMGEKPPKSDAPQGAAAPATQPGAELPQQQATPEEITAAANKEVNRPDGRSALVQLLGKDGVPGKDEIRKKFDAAEAGAEKLALLANAEKTKNAMEHFLGYTDATAKRHGEAFLQSLDGLKNDKDKRRQAAQWLVDSLGNLRAEYPHHPRFQRLLDQAAMQLLIQTAEEIAALPVDQLQGRRADWQETIENLSRLTSVSPDDPYKDAVSQLLEYVHCLGDFNSDTFTAYENYLKERGLVMPTYVRIGKGILWDTHDVKYRFASNGNKMDQSYVRGYSLFGHPAGVLPACNRLLQEAKEKDWR